MHERSRYVVHSRRCLVSCSANSLDSSRRSLSTERPPCFVSSPHRSTGYGYGLAPRLTTDFARSFIVGTYGTGHRRPYTLMLGHIKLRQALADQPNG